MLPPRSAAPLHVPPMREWDMRVTLGDTQRALQLRRDAEASYDAALAGYRQHQRPRGTHAAYAYLGLGRLRLDQNRRREAVEALTWAKAVLDRAHVDEPSGRAAVEAALALAQ